MADLRELPALAIEQPEQPEQPPTRSSRRSGVTNLNIEAYFNRRDLDTIRYSGYPRPNEFFNTNVQALRDVFDDVNTDIRTLTGQINGRNNTLNPAPE